MNKEELLQLRGLIVDQTRKIALEGETDPASQLEVLMGLIRSGDTSKEVMERTYEAAQALPDDTDKMGAFLDIIYEIDADLADMEASGGDDRGPENS